MSVLGDILKRCREERDLSLSEVSKLTTIDKGYLSRLESGKKLNPSLFVIRTLCHVLKINKTDGQTILLITGICPFDSENALEKWAKRMLEENGAI